MRIKPGILLAFILLVPCLGRAQVGPARGERPQRPIRVPADAYQGKWWKNSDIVRDLQITDAQVAQLERIFQDSRLKLIDLRADLEKQEAQLQPLVEADQPDEGKVSAQIDLVSAARGRLEKANAMMMLASSFLDKVS